MFFFVTRQCVEVIHNILQFITTKDVQLAHGNIETIEDVKYSSQFVHASLSRISAWWKQRRQQYQQKMQKPETKHATPKEQWCSSSAVRLEDIQLSKLILSFKKSACTGVC